MTVLRAPGLVPAALALSLLVAPTRLPGQEEPRTAAPPFPVFGAETRLVVLAVFVTDKNGKAVVGLTPADFEVEDGGKRAEVVAFQAVDAGAAASDVEASTPAVEAATRRQRGLRDGASAAGPVAGGDGGPAASDGKMTALETTGPVRLVNDRDGAFRIVLSLVPSGIPAGDYALRVTLRDETGDQVHSEQSVAVR